MDTEIQSSKLALRGQVRERLRAMTEAQRAGASAQARALLAAKARWQNAQSILLFAPMPEELDVWPLLGEALRAGKRVFLPRFVGEGGERSEVRSQRAEAEGRGQRAEAEGSPDRLNRDLADSKGGGQKAEAEAEGGTQGTTKQPGHYVVCEVSDPDKDILAGQFGIREPVEGCAELPLNRLDLILVPGVAFDLHGHRLGRGKGFYDQLLAAVRGTTCGVAFDQQIAGEIPVEPHDVHVNCILTPTRWIEL